MHVLRIDQRAALARVHGKWPVDATHYRWHARSCKGCGREDDTRHTAQDIQHGTKDPRHMKTHCSKDSATGTRTRVAGVRAEYPNQLDHSGFTCDAVMGARLHFLVAFVHSVGTPPRDSNPCRSTSFTFKTEMTPAGLEPAIPGSVGRCLIYWATGR